MNIRTLFEKRGTERSISGNSPVLLDGEEHVWCILSGSAELFIMQIDNMRQSGRKTHIATVPEGSLLFGLDGDGYGTEQHLQAVGFPGTRIALLPLTELIPTCTEAGLADELARQIDRWVALLSAGITKDIPYRPRPGLLLEPTEKLRITEKTVVSVRKDTVWVASQEAGLLFIGMEVIDADRGGLYLPVSGASWFDPLGDTSLKVLSTADALARGIVWPSLSSFHELMFGIMFINTRFSAVDTFNLANDSAMETERAKEAGLAELAATLADTYLLPTPVSGDDRTVAACTLIGSRLGIEIREPVRKKGRQESKAYTVEDIAQASRVHIRKITLSGRWWRNDNGPLLGFVSEGAAPVALLPLSSRSYEMVTPTTGEHQKVSASLAASLLPDAYTFYRPLPLHPLSVKQLLSFGSVGCGRDILMLILAALFIGMLSMAIPLATGLIFNDVIPCAERSRLMQITAIIASLAVATLLFELVRNIALLRIESRIDGTLQAAVWDRLLRLPVPFFREFTAGDLTQRSMAITVIRQLASGAFVTTVIGTLFVFPNFLLMLRYNAGLTLAAILPLTFISLIIFIAGRYQLTRLSKVADIQGTLGGLMFQFFSALNKIRVSGSEDKVFALWAREFSKQKRLAYQGGLAGALLQTSVTLLQVFSMTALFAWFTWGKTAMNAGDFLAFNSAYSVVQAALFQVVSMLGLVAGVVPQYRRMKPILEATPEGGTVKTDPGELSGRIEISRVSFRYRPELPFIIRDLSIRIEPGEFVAIVGSSGSGKSTLIRLLLGFETPESGAIFYDDQDLQDLDATKVRRKMGVVIQGAQVMPGDIFHNIIGSATFTLDDAWEAARMAGLEEDIKRMPMGMHTVITQGGGTFSGGQKQRLMIARALVSRPSVLIFDEATSALDNRTQAITSESLKKLKTTRIVVAHRLSTIIDADRIYVLDRGEIAETGSYQELMEQDGLFRKLATRQIV